MFAFECETGIYDNAESSVTFLIATSSFLNRNIIHAIGRKLPGYRRSLLTNYEDDDDDNMHD